MNLLRHLRRCNAWSPDSYVPFAVADRQVGWVRRDFVAVCARHPDAFETTAESVRVADRWTTFDDRTRAVDAALRRLAEQGHFSRWRDEPYAVVTAPGTPPYLHMERAAVARFGILGTGVHLNGFVRAPDGLHMWVGRRSPHRPTEPGKLDQLVAGGQPATLSLTDNLIKECAEEAAIPAALAATAVPVGAVAYVVELAGGLRRDILYLYDLSLHRDFVPRNTDGETESFRLMPVAEVVDVLIRTDDFKFNCALVAIDFLIRHGVLLPDTADYLALRKGLVTHDGTL